MLNGEARRVDRERLNRVANATGQSVASLHANLESKKAVVNPGPVKEWRVNSGQHYPEFGESETPKIEIGTVRVAKPKRVIHGKRLSDEAFKAEFDAQTKRAQALAYLAQTQDGVPDDCLRGEAGMRRQREKKIAKIAQGDNTLKLLAEQKLQSKLNSIQSRLRDVSSTQIKKEPVFASKAKESPRKEQAAHPSPAIVSKVEPVSETSAKSLVANEESLPKKRPPSTLSFVPRQARRRR